MLNNLPANPARRARRSDPGRATPGRPNHRLDCAGSEEAPVQVIAGLLNVSHPGPPNVTPQSRSGVGHQDSPNALSTATIEAFNAHDCEHIGKASLQHVRCHIRRPEFGIRKRPHGQASHLPVRIPRRAPDRRIVNGLGRDQRFQGKAAHASIVTGSLADQPFRPRSGIEHLGARPVLAEPPARSPSENSTIDEAE